MRFAHITTLVLGLLLFNIDAGASEDRAFYVYNAANGLADNSAQTITCTKTGRLVITTVGQINFFDGQQFTFINPETENQYPLSNYNGHYHLYFDKHHHLWLKNKHTVTCVNLLTERFVDNIITEFHELGMDDKVMDLFVDQRNMVWLLTEKGIFSCKSKKYYEVRKDQNLQDLMLYKDKYLMLFYGNGDLDMFELDSGKLVHTSSAYSYEERDDFAKTSLVYPVGDIFYQIRNGKNGAVLLRFDYEKKHWEMLLKTPYYLSGLKEKDSVLYIPSAYGYWTYDIPTGRMNHEEELQMYGGQKLTTDINAIEFDRQGGMWVGTQKRGLLYSRPYKQPFQVYRWTDNRAMELFQLLEQRSPKLETIYRDRTVNCIFRDSRGWDWVGTSSGLQLYRKRSDRLPRMITRNDGLLNNVIHTIVEDGFHNIWVGTSYGICCLFIEKDDVKYINRYNEWDGLPKESYVDGRAIRMEDGRIVMQALDHIVVFNPDSMVTLQHKFPFEIYPKLIRLFVNGNDIRAGQALDGKVILENALTRTKEINLNYYQNSVSLTFSGLNYFRPQQTFYRARVTGPGMDGKWKIYTPYNSQGLVDGRGQLHLPMPSLLPGTYTIEVQCSMLPDDWESTPYEWVINVNQPWWRTTGMIMLLGFILMGLFAYLTYLYMRNANLKVRRNTEEQGVLKRIKSFADRCEARNGLLLEPERGSGSQVMVSLNEFSPKFVQTMITILPTVSSKSTSQLSMRELSEAAGMSLQDFYSLVSANIYKNPRPIVMEVMMSKVVKMLMDARHYSLAEIAKECGFSSPNFLIASFFQKYKQTPEAYRSQAVH